MYTTNCLTLACNTERSAWCQFSEIFGRIQSIFFGIPMALLCRFIFCCILILVWLVRVKVNLTICSLDSCQVAPLIIFSETYSWAKKINLYAFVDLEKGLGRVRRDVVWFAMHKLDVKESFVMPDFVLRVNGTFSEAIVIKDQYSVL